jgi:hypothetical protein
MSGPQRVVLGAWLAFIGLTVAKSLSGGRGLPQPGVFLGSAALFTGYYVLSGIGPLGTLAATFAVGTDVAAVFLPYLPESYRTAIGLPAKSGAGVIETLTGNLAQISAQNQSQATAGTLRPGQPS